MSPYASADLTLCASSRFYDEVARIAKFLSSAGFVVLTPRLDMNETLVDVDRQAKFDLTRDFLQKVEAAQAIYIVNPGGYVGMSVAIEVGFAVSRGKPVYALARPIEPAVEALVSAVRSPESFVNERA